MNEALSTQTQHQPSEPTREEVRLDLKFTRHSKLASNTQKPLSKQSHHLALWVMDQVTQVSAETHLFYFIFFSKWVSTQQREQTGGGGIPVMN